MRYAGWVLIYVVAVAAAVGQVGMTEELYKKGGGVQTGWSTFENLNSVKGAGGTSNAGAKGHPMETLHAGERKVILDVAATGTIRRIWLTLSKRDPETLRGVRIAMYWDGANTPAVSAPVGDFFGAMGGRMTAFESALFSDPEGRSFNCVVPMPFRQGARVEVINDLDTDIGMLFYEIDFTREEDHGEDTLYFHAYWRRNPSTTLKQDFELLPPIKGEGRYLGAHLAVKVHDENIGWWGEGEVKIYLDGDTKLPTLVGTGTEDYIGTGWGQSTYAHRYQGCLVADSEAKLYTFYRYHVPDPVYFYSDCRVTLQQMGGSPKKEALEALEKSVNIEPATLIPDTSREADDLVKFYERNPVPKLDDPTLPDGWVNHWRSDDWSAMALFYLDRPENGLPELQSVAERIAGVGKAES